MPVQEVNGTSFRSNMGIPASSGDIADRKAVKPRATSADAYGVGTDSVPRSCKDDDEETPLAVATFAGTAVDGDRTL
jgi:hypothetical protein